MSGMRSWTIALLVLWTGSDLAQTFEWKVAAPDEAGMSAQRLDAMKESLAKRGTKSLLVVRRDRIVLEWYAEGHSREKAHYTASLAKSLIGGMSLAVGMQDGRVRPEDPASRFVPQWRKDP